MVEIVKPLTTIARVNLELELTNGQLAPLGMRFNE
jgi:hypothetical protein